MTFRRTCLIITAILGFAAGPCPAQAGDVSDESPDGLIRHTYSSREEDPFSGVSFPTMYNTGLDTCTNENGQPVIFLFSSASCPRCEWAGEIFDFIARYYLAGGHVEAHHYDVNTGDDLLTEEIETEIPPAHLQIKEHGNPKGYVPYFNFSCKYERIGNGYEEENDTAAEGAEIRDVIETLVSITSK